MEQTDTGAESLPVLVFDLDGTLYDASNGYVDYIRSNIFEFMYEMNLVSREVSAEEIWRPLFQRYNQSYKGLRLGGYSFDRDEYWRFHRRGVERFLTENEALREMLTILPHKKVIFTNCREREALEALKALGIVNYFDKVYGADFLGDYCKPDIEAFELLLADLAIPGHQVIFFEDSLKNLHRGHSFGMKTVLIEGMTLQEETEGGENQLPDYVHVAVSTLTDGGKELQKKFPSLFLPVNCVDN